MQRIKNALLNNVRSIIIDIVISIVVGIVIGISVTFLSEIHELIWTFRSFLVTKSLIFILLCTIIGLTLAYLIVQIFAIIKTTGCGTSQVIEAYHYRKGFLSMKDFITKTIASAITIGFGGSAGLEGPSLLLGGGIASSIGQKIRLNPEKIRAFMIAGAAAGLAAIFKAPFTGILFALEIPYKRHLVKEVFIFASISSISSYLTFIFFKGGTPLFPPLLVSQTPFYKNISSIMYTVIEGILVAGMALFFIFFFRIIKNATMRMNNKVSLVMPMLGGLIVGLLGIVNPRILGIGYDTIASSVNGELYKVSLELLFTIFILKIIATSITLNFGGSGGLFIPSIFVGAIFGIMYTRILGLGFDEVLVMAAMAASIAALNKTLLTSIAFVAETCGPISIIPSTIAACISYLTSGNWSFYEEQLPSKPEEEEEALVELEYLIKSSSLKETDIRANEVMSKNPIAIQEDMSLEDAIALISQYEFRVYPVITKSGQFIGTIQVEDVLAIPKERWKLPISQILIRNAVLALPNDNLQEIAERMIQENKDHVYVVSDFNSMKLIGVISGIDILRAFLKANISRSISDTSSTKIKTKQMKSLI